MLERRFRSLISAYTNHGLRRRTRKSPILHVWRCYSDSKSGDDSRSFGDTLLLPKTNFPLRADPTQREVPFRTRTCDDLYRWQWENVKGPLFVLHDGPPYANGDIHMGVLCSCSYSASTLSSARSGHALNKIIKDIICRYHLLRGRRVQ